MIHLLKPCELWVKNVSLSWMAHCDKLRRFSNPSVGRTSSLDSLFAAFRGTDESRNLNFDLRTKSTGKLSTPVAASNQQSSQVLNLVSTMEGNFHMLKMRYASQSKGLNLRTRNSSTSRRLSRTDNSEERRVISGTEEGNLPEMSCEADTSLPTLSEEPQTEKTASEPPFENVTDSGSSDTQSGEDRQPAVVHQQSRMKEVANEEPISASPSMDSVMDQLPAGEVSPGGKIGSGVKMIKLSKLPNNPDELCALFHMKTSSIFSGGK